MSILNNRVERINLRHNRAMRMVAATFHAIKKHIDDDAWEAVHDALMKLFTEEGVEIFTDADRAQLGLPPRGPDGWTAEEIVAMDHRITSALVAPVPPVFVAWPK